MPPKTKKSRIFKIGEIVVAKWDDGLYYEAIIKKIDRGKYTVCYLADNVTQIVGIGKLQKIPIKNAPEKATKKPAKKPPENTLEKATKKPAKKPPKNTLENPIKTPITNLTEISSNNPLKNPIETPITNLTEISSNNPLENPIETPINNPLENPIATPITNLTEISSNNPLENPIETPINNPLENPIETPINNLLENPIKTPITNLTEISSNNPLENPIETPINNPLENPIATLITNLTEISSNNPLENPIETPITNLTEISSNNPLVNPLKTPINNLTEISINNPLENPIETPINDLTKILTNNSLANPIETQINYLAETSTNKPTKKLKENPILSSELATENKEENVPEDEIFTLSTNASEESILQLIGLPMYVLESNQLIENTDPTENDLNQIQFTSLEILDPNENEDAEIQINQIIDELEEDLDNKASNNTEMETDLEDSEFEDGNDSDYIQTSESERNDEFKITEDDNTTRPKKSHSSINFNQSSDEEIEVDTSKKQIVKDKDKATNSKNSKLSSESSSEQSTKIKNENITVVCTDNQPGKRGWDKRFPCFYCEKLVAKVPRHWYSQHKTEIEVARIMATKSATTKLPLIALLRNKGIHKHNLNVLKTGSGKLLVAYRPDYYADYSQYIPCEKCFGYYVGSTLFKHSKRCIVSKEIIRNPKISGRLLLPSSTSVPEILRKIVEQLKDGEIKLIIRNDPLILLFGSKIYSKAANQEFQENYVRYRMRELARLIQGIRKDSDYAGISLTELINPKYFDNIVKATKQLAGFCSEKNILEKPTLARRLGISLKMAAKILRVEGIKKDDEKVQERVRNFLKVFKSDWIDLVSITAARSLKRSKMNNPCILPLSNDIKLLTDYLKEKNNYASGLLLRREANIEYLIENFKTLTEVTLVEIFVFNRRRQGEVSKLTIEFYKHALEKNQKSLPSSADILCSLSPMEQALCNVFTRIEIIGKRERAVPILLTKKHIKSMDLLCNEQLRTLVGINPDNKFVFAVGNRNSLNYVRGCDVLRKYSNLCGAKDPTSLRSTKLRKHIATLSQVLNLENHELDVLAQYMGHDINVHREYYRLPSDVIQLAKTSKILVALDSGKIKDIAGKKLDEININLDEEILESSGDSESDGNNDDDEYEKYLKSKKPKTKKKVPSKKTKRAARKKELDSNVRNKQNKSSAKNKEKVSAEPKTRIKWTEPEKECLIKYFENQIFIKKIPGKKEIEKCLKTNPILHKRDWKNIKYFIANYLKK